VEYILGMLSLPPLSLVHYTQNISMKTVALEPYYNRIFPYRSEEWVCILDFLWNVKQLYPKIIQAAGTALPEQTITTQTHK